jgi:hypothetical protein
VIPASRQRNFLQSALYVAIAGVLAAVLLERLLTYAEAAEKAVMEATVSRLSSALYARVAFLALRGEYDAIEALSGQSPFAVTRATSPAYAGEFDGLPPDAEGGKWYFDRLRRELVYLPNLKRHFEGADEDAPVPAIRFRVEVQKASKNAYTGVVLRPVGAATWDPRS